MNMKTNWTLQDKPNEYHPLSKEDFDKLVNDIQDEIDQEILDRYEWDWEFRQSVDRVMDNPPHSPWVDGVKVSGRV
jgi:hypothetical protein